jgi:hypothetical protein
LTLKPQPLLQENAPDEQEPAIDHEDHATDEQAPDTVMNDTESESEGGEVSTTADMSVPLKQVCPFFVPGTNLYQETFCTRF